MPNYSRDMFIRHMQILDDSTHLVDTTTNPKTFFTRYKLMIDTLTQLSELEKFVDINGGQPSDSLKTAIDPIFYEKQVNKFLERSYEKMIHDAHLLKTEKGRINKANKYFSEVEFYKDIMLDSNLTLLDRFKQEKAWL